MTPYKDLEEVIYLLVDVIAELQQRVELLEVQINNETLE